MAILGFFSGKGDHPLADPKEAREALAPLAAAKSQGAVEDIAAWLEPLPGAEDLKLARRVEIALMLDEAGVAHARRLARDYLTASVARVQQQRMWSIGRSYWQRLIIAYEDCLTRLAAAPRSLDAEKTSLACARLIHGYAARYKWDQFRYGPIDPAMWSAAGGVYLQAHAARLEGKSFRLYANSADNTGVELEYLKLLVFHASSIDKLLPLEIELAERLISWFLPYFVFTDQTRPDNVYWVDMAQPLPPTRLVKLPQAAPSLRFFSTGKALDAIEQLKTRIDKSKEIPADLPLGGQYPLPTVVAVLDHLAMCWAPKPPMRSSDRHRITTLLAVIHDMNEIRARLAGDASAQQGETWVAENISLGGMAARVALAGNDWIQVGSLVAMRPEGSEQWLVGVIRRFARESQTEGAVGIETIGKSPRAVEMQCSGITNGAILLEAPLRPGEMVSMALPERAWEDFMPATVNVDGAQSRLLPFGISYQGVGFLIGRYRVDTNG